MGLKHFINGIFRGSDSYDAITVLSDLLCKASSKYASAAIDGFDGIQKTRHFYITKAALWALINMTDRKAFETIPSKRDKVMDTLARHIIKVLVVSYLEPVWRNDSLRDQESQISNAMTELIHEYNEKSVLYGNCKIISIEGDDGLKGTFFWEFGKQFAESADHPMDIKYCTAGAELLLHVMTSLNKNIERLLNQAKVT